MKKKYCITGKAILEFTKQVELTEEEYNKLQHFGSYYCGSDGFNILFDNVDITDYDCEVDEYDLFDIEKIND